MKIIACYSNKGGVGKTATSVNRDYAYAQTGQRILLCDLDHQGASGFCFRAADEIVVPVSRTTLTERSFGQLDGFFNKRELRQKSCERSFRWCSIGSLSALTQIAARLVRHIGYCLISWKIERGRPYEQGN